MEKEALEVEEKVIDHRDYFFSFSCCLTHSVLVLFRLSWEGRGDLFSTSVRVFSLVTLIFGV